jgi:hypothetical protein
LEKIIILVFYLLLSLWLFIGFSMTDATIPVAIIVGCIHAVWITAIIYLLYKRIRKSIYLHKVYKYINLNQYDRVNQIQDKAINNQPKLMWLKIDKAIALAYAGKVAEFYANFNELVKFRKFGGQFNSSILLVVYFILKIVTGNSSNEVYLSDKKIYKSKNIFYKNVYEACKNLVDQNYQLTIDYCQKINLANSLFYKFVRSYLLFQSYTAVGNFQKANDYQKYLIQNPVSNELKFIET